MSQVATVKSASPNNDLRDHPSFASSHYMFQFKNMSDRPVKMHIREKYLTGRRHAQDRKEDGTRSAVVYDYFCMVPPMKNGEEIIDIPINTNTIIITAGFFHAKKGIYEIFWENNTFEWQPNSAIIVQPRRHTKMKRLSIDVSLDAPEAMCDKLDLSVSVTSTLPTVDGSCLHNHDEDGSVVASQNKTDLHFEQDGVGTALRQTLADSTEELDSREMEVVRPALQRTMVPVIEASDWYGAHHRKRLGPKMAEHTLATMGSIVCSASEEDDGQQCNNHSMEASGFATSKTRCPGGGGAVALSCRGWLPDKAWKPSGNNKRIVPHTAIRAPSLAQKTTNDDSIEPSVNVDASKAPNPLSSLRKSPLPSGSSLASTNLDDASETSSINSTVHSISSSQTAQHNEPGFGARVEAEVSKVVPKKSIIVNYGTQESRLVETLSCNESNMAVLII